MELFTLGVGNYTETDIREAARALTGWTVLPNRRTEAVFIARRHDDGLKSLFGVTGNFDGDKRHGYPLLASGVRTLRLRQALHLLHRPEHRASRAG